MARTRFTRRRALPWYATPQQYIVRFRTYQVCYGDTFQELLRDYQEVWIAARVHGITGNEGILRLVTILPFGWREYALYIAPAYLWLRQDAPPAGREEDLPAFISTLSHLDREYGCPPFVPRVESIPSLLPLRISRPPTPPVEWSPIRPTSSSQPEDEAGPSTARQTSPPPAGDRGKAPMLADSSDDEDEAPQLKWERKEGMSRDATVQEWEQFVGEALAEADDFGEKTDEVFRLLAEFEREEESSEDSEEEESSDDEGDPEGPDEHPEEGEDLDGHYEEEDLAEPMEAEDEDEEDPEEYVGDEGPVGEDEEEEDPEEFIFELLDAEMDVEEEPVEPDFAEGDGEVIDAMWSSDDEDDDDEPMEIPDYDSDHSTICSE